MLFYILSEVIPVVIFFIVVVNFDISFTSGDFVGFIFFTQHLDQFDVYINPFFTSLQVPHRLFYGLFNMEFFTVDWLSFCLWKGANILDVITFKFLTIMIAFVLVLILVALMKKNHCRMLWEVRSQLGAKT